MYRRAYTQLILLLLLSGAALMLTGCKVGKAPEQQIIRIAMPYNEQILDVDTNYYKLWLEKKTGLKLEIEFIPQNYTGEYLRLLFSSGNSNIDVIFFNAASGFPSAGLMEDYGNKGYIMPLENYIDTDGRNLKKLFGSYTYYDLRKKMSSRNGHIYYMPSLDIAEAGKNTQTLWLNAGWLHNLKLPMPRTTGDLAKVLRAFRDMDPNGNGIADEIPAAGSSEGENEQICYFIINSFVYNDPFHSNMAVRDGRVYFVPVTDEWRKGLLYCRDLYAEGLLNSQCFTFSKAQLIRLVNDPRDLVGAFTCNSISDVLSQNSPELVSQYVHIPPLEGPEGIRWSTVATPLPIPGGVITSACKNPEAAFRLMDLMIGEEASLIGRYGEPGVDWDYAEKGDINSYGEPALIAVKNQMWDKPQNKHLRETGPFVAYAKYVDRVAWKGFQADKEYLDARAARSYSPYEPVEYVKAILFDKEEADRLEAIQQGVDEYTKAWMYDFICSSRDISDDNTWKEYLQGYQSLKLDVLVAAVQKSYYEH